MPKTTSIVLTLEITIDDTTPAGKRQFIGDFVDNLKNDSRSCFARGGLNLMGYDGPFLRSIKVKTASS